MSLKKEVWSWAFYDFANSGYGVIIASLLFPVFYRTFLAGNTGQGDFFWGLSVGISILLAALASPIVGAIADHAKNKKELLVISTSICIICTAALYFAPTAGLFFASLIFIIANMTYTIGAILYDSFLQDVATHHTKGRVSGLGWGLGYIGGLVAMVAIAPLYISGFEGAALSKYLWSYPAVAAFFLLFALPSFIFLKSHRHAASYISAKSALPAAMRSMFLTLKNWRQHKNLLLFFIAFYLLSDGLNTIFSFTAIYASTTLGLATSKIALVIAMVYIVGFPATLIAGRLTDKWGAKPVIMLATLGWIVVVVWLMSKPSFISLLGTAALTGVVIGSSQAPARTLLARLVPVDQSSQFFGFNGLASKISASLGPVLFGLISWLSGSQVIALASIIPFFACSILVFFFVKEPPLPEDPSIRNAFIERHPRKE